jgi:hypothetical protein
MLIMIVGSSAAVHGVLSLLARSPIFTPDEWLYAQLSRSILHGHPGEVAGGHISIWSTTSYLGPAITSPLWLIHDVGVAYHLSLAAASISFALAALPAYALGRRVGLETNTALVAALLSQLVPSGVFTSTLLAEPYAYPALLAAVLIAIEAIAAPTARRVAGVLGASAALCLIGGMQFFVFPLAVAVAWIASATSERVFAIRALVAATAAGGVVLLLWASGQGSAVTRIEDSVLYQRYPLNGIAAWFGVNVFVLALASGWVIVPIAAVGLRRMLRTREQPTRSFAWLTISLIAGVLVEAAIWGANGNGLYERFTFYGTPLLAIAALRELTRNREAPRTPYALLAYGAACAALLVPLTSYVIMNEGHSPTLLGLTDGRAIRVAWPIVAAALAIAAAMVGAGSARLLVPLAAAALVATAGLGYRALLGHQTGGAPNAHASENAVLLVNPIQVQYARSAMRMLFWNPHIDRIVVMGENQTPDLPALPGGALSSPAGVRTAQGAVQGPYVVGDAVSAWRDGHALARGTATELAAPPDLLAFGWVRDGQLLPYSELIAAGRRHGARRITMRLTSLGDPHLRMNVVCSGSRRGRTLAVPQRGHVDLVVEVPPATSRACRLSVAPQGATAFDERRPVARATVAAAAAAT